MVGEGGGGGGGGGGYLLFKRWGRVRQGVGGQNIIAIIK